MSTTDTCLRCGQHGHTSSSCTRLRLFSRTAGGSIKPRTIAKAAAHRVLDKAMAGDKHAIERMDWALRVTGDLAPLHASGARAHLVPGVPA